MNNPNFSPYKYFVHGGLDQDTLMHLFTNKPDLSSYIHRGLFHEPTYKLYKPVPWVWQSLNCVPKGLYWSRYGSANYVKPDNGEIEVYQGCFLTGLWRARRRLILWRMFDCPVTLSVAGTRLSVPIEVCAAGWEPMNKESYYDPLEKFNEQGKLANLNTDDSK